MRRNKMKVYPSQDGGIRFSQLFFHELFEMTVKNSKMELCLGDGTFFNLVGRVIINGLVGIEWSDEAFQGMLAEVEETLNKNIPKNKTTV
jgi:hypothetical protein